MTLNVNGRSRTVDVDPATPLLYVLSDDLELRGPKFGCGLGQCGACTVIVNGQAIRSCVTPVSTVGGAAITTLEGLGTPEKPHPIQQAFIDEQAAQCGFCLSGVILTAKALPRPESARHRRADSAGAVGRAVPVLRQRPDAQRDPPLREGRSRHEGAAHCRTRARRLTRAGFSRRAFLKGSGALVVTLRVVARRSTGSAPCSRRASTAPAARSSIRGSRSAQDGMRHRLHRQVRVRPGALHRADAAGRRRAVRAVRSRAADAVRHVDDAGSGHDVRAAVASRRTSTRANLALAAATAREALVQLASRRGSARRPTQLVAGDGAVSVARRRVDAA